MDIDALLAKLEEAHPESTGFLRYNSPFELLIGVGLSAQTTDDQVNQVTPELFGRYPDPAALAGARQEDVEEIIFTTGFYRQKARHAIAAGKMLEEEFGGVVPQTMVELTCLPGIGRKSASVVLGAVFGEAVIIVDTHFSRVVRRLGLTEEKDPYKIEMALKALVPEGRQYQFSMLINRHGRRYCTAKKPRCLDCPLAPMCPSRIG